MQAHPHLLLSLFALGVCVLAAICDLRTRRIPNRLIAIGLAGALVLSVGLHVSAGLAALGTALLRCLLGLVCCSLWPIALYAARGLGGGDVKLLAFVGACLGPLLGLEAQLYAFSFGLIYSVGYLIYERSLLHALRLSANAIVNPFLPRARRRPAALEPLSIPFGPAIGIGVAVAVLSRGWS